MHVCLSLYVSADDMANKPHIICNCIQCACFNSVCCTCM